MKKEIKIIDSCRCYTTLLVNGERHNVPTRELEEWIEYFEKRSSVNEKE